MCLFGTPEHQPTLGCVDPMQIGGIESVHEGNLINRGDSGKRPAGRNQNPSGQSTEPSSSNRNGADRTTAVSGTPP